MLQNEEHNIKEGQANPQPMRKTRVDWQAYISATACHVCEKSPEGDSVRDHCYITGKNRGSHNAATLSCGWILEPLPYLW